MIGMFYSSVLYKSNVTTISFLISCIVHSYQQSSRYEGTSCRCAGGNSITLEDQENFFRVHIHHGSREAGYAQLRGSCNLMHFS